MTRRGRTGERRAPHCDLTPESPWRPSREHTGKVQGYSPLGWTEITVHVVPLDEIARGEFAENMVRKAFTPTEEVAIYRALERWKNKLLNNV